jgi:acyl phosphate:glycerol-3-phosphate acyltransferase
VKAEFVGETGAAMSPEVFLVAAFVIGYLLGSIPFGLILTRLAGTQDLRSIGSGNIGATNVLRTGRKGLAAATLICDMLKGTLAVMIAGYFGGPDAAMLAALAAFLGHLFPVWLRFRGGKGVAVYIGVLLGLFWPAALVFCVIWLTTALTTRYSSLAALVASVVTPIFLWWFGHFALAALFALLTLLLFFMHRENIKRLQTGSEGKIGHPPLPESMGHNGGPPLG